jgi:hypothetical protein
VTVEAHCEWTPVSTVNWITVPAATTRGNGSAQFTVAANPAGTQRQGQLQIAGQAFTVTQQPLLAPVTVTLIGETMPGICPGDDVCPARFGGGSVTANGFTCSIAEAEGTPGPGKQVCTGNFPVGFNVTFTAQPGPNSDFSGWGSPCGTGVNCTILVTAAGQSLTATFIPEVILLITGDSDTIQLTSSVAGLACTSQPRLVECRLQTDNGTDVTLTSSVADVFWSGCDTPPNETTASTTCQLLMTRHRFVTVSRTPCCQGLLPGVRRPGVEPVQRR